MPPPTHSQGKERFHDNFASIWTTTDWNLNDKIDDIGTLYDMKVVGSNPIAYM